MSQHDFSIANQTAANARSDINSALQALASLSSGSTAPSTTYANQLWYDTASNQIKMRNEANSDWIVLGTVGTTFEPSGGLPAGAVQSFAMSTAPSGWLDCDGSAVSRTTYSNLFSAIGTTFGTGDGSTTFNVPDLRGEFIRGWDDGRGVDSGRTFGTAQADEFRACPQPSDTQIHRPRHWQPIRVRSRKGCPPITPCSAPPATGSAHQGFRPAAWVATDGAAHPGHSSRPAPFPIPQPGYRTQLRTDSG